MTTVEQSWRARWKAAAKNYRLRLKNPIQATHFCPNCNATETRSAELEAAITAYARQRRRDLRKMGALRAELDEALQRLAEECHSHAETVEQRDKAQAEVEKLRAENEKLRLALVEELPSLELAKKNAFADGYHDGLSFALARLDALPASLKDEPEPPEYQRTADPDC